MNFINKSLFGLNFKLIYKLHYNFSGFFDWKLCKIIRRTISRRSCSALLSESWGWNQASHLTPLQKTRQFWPKGFKGALYCDSISYYYQLLWGTWAPRTIKEKNSIPAVLYRGDYCPKFQYIFLYTHIYVYQYIYIYMHIFIGLVFVKFQQIINLLIIYFNIYFICWFYIFNYKICI